MRRSISAVDFFHRIDIGLNFIHRRTDVNVNAGDAQILQIAVLLENALGPFDVDAELVSFFPVVVLTWVLGSTSGLMRMAPTAVLPDRAGDAIDVFDLRFGFEIERGDAGVERIARFPRSVLPTPA